MSFARPHVSVPESHQSRLLLLSPPPPRSPPPQSKWCSSIELLSGPLNLCTIENDALFHLITFLEIDTLNSVVFLSRSMRDTVKSYFAILHKLCLRVATLEIKVIKIIIKKNTMCRYMYTNYSCIEF